MVGPAKDNGKLWVGKGEVREKVVISLSFHIMSESLFMKRNIKGTWMGRELQFLKLPFKSGNHDFPQFEVH